MLLACLSSGRCGASGAAIGKLHGVTASMFWGMLGAGSKVAWLCTARACLAVCLAWWQRGVLDLAGLAS